MFIVGLVLLVLGLVLGIGILWIIGLVLMLVGLVFWFGPAPYGGRRWY
jgi:hypothetical protein